MRILHSRAVPNKVPYYNLICRYVYSGLEVVDKKIIKPTTIELGLEFFSQVHSKNCVNYLTYTSTNYNEFCFSVLEFRSSSVVSSTYDDREMNASDDMLLSTNISSKLKKYPIKER